MRNDKSIKLVVTGKLEVSGWEDSGWHSLSSAFRERFIFVGSINILSCGVYSADVHEHVPYIRVCNSTKVLKVGRACEDEDTAKVRSVELLLELFSELKLNLF